MTSINIDHDKFDTFQKCILREIIEEIYRSCINAGVTDKETIRSIVGDSAFGVSGIIDGNRTITIDDTEVVSKLLFLDVSSEDTLISSDTIAKYSGSWMHELAYPAAYKYVDKFK